MAYSDSLSGSTINRTLQLNTVRNANHNIIFVMICSQDIPIFRNCITQLIWFMEKLKKYFLCYTEISDPVIHVGIPGEQYFRFGLGYRSTDSDKKSFIVKFNFGFPNNHCEVISVIHGYAFIVEEGFVVNQNLKKLAWFFSYLVQESLKKVNDSSSIEGLIEAPPIKELCSAILTGLISKSN